MTATANSQLDLLRDEYKILQDKIDKIGAFRFTIRGWSVTAVVGGFLAGSGVKTLPTLLISTSVGISLLFFLFFEKQQVVLSNRFIVRARKIEDLVKDHEGAAFVSPLIARSARSKVKGASKGISWYDFFLPKWLRIRMLKATRALSILVESHALFYFVLILLSFTPEALPHLRTPMQCIMRDFTAIWHAFLHVICLAQSGRS